MKKLALMLLSCFSFLLGIFWLAACSGSGTSQTPASTLTPTPTKIPSPTPEWTLVWADEFNLPDGSQLDPEFWNYAAGTGTGGWGNGESQYYTDRIENVFIEDGALVIQAIEEQYMGAKYTSARLNTMIKAEFTYGRFEARTKLPNTQGVWPAIWLLPTFVKYGTWPACGEIDIMELIGSQPDQVHGTLHFGNPHKSLKSTYTLPGGATFDQDFHTFALEWEPDQIRWYVDGYLYHQVDSAEWFTSYKNAPETAPFDQPFHLIVNVAVGGNWPGYPDESSEFPQQMVVDYVRVYQK